MHYGAPQEIVTDGGKNLWGDVVQEYLKKIKTIHKGTSTYHPRTNGKVESLNGLISGMLTRYLLNKPTKVWDLYLDQALFACRVRTHATTKTSPYYLVYGKQPRLVNDDNHPLDVHAPLADYRSTLLKRIIEFLIQQPFNQGSYSCFSPTDIPCSIASMWAKRRPL
jgi:hypothetical protein